MIFFLVSVCGDLLATVTRPWRQLFWLALHLYVSICSIVLNRVSEAFSRCIEVVTAYRRTKELEKLLFSLRRDYEDEKLRNSELQRKLDAFTRDRRRIMETLDIVTVEKKKVVETVRFLKNKVQELEYMNQQLAENEETQRRGLADTVPALTTAAKQPSEKKSLKQDSMNMLSFEHNSLMQAKDVASKTLHDVFSKDSYLESSNEMQSLMTMGSSLMQTSPKDLEVLSSSESEHGVAFISSMFSASLATLVAMIAWEAKDPCTPLVVALFIVVGMSLANVVRIFNKLDKLHSHQGGFIAVALLSLNWFMLGTLAQSALPYLGQMGSGALYVLGDRIVRILGFGKVIQVVKAASNEAFELY